MPTERIDESKVTAKEWILTHLNCRDPNHNPPNMIVLNPGRYRHTCPSCGKVVEFDVPYLEAIS